MLIDWFTVAAQAVNFLILVWLMKRFLYKPVLLAIDTREKKIAADIADASAKLADAQKQGDLYRGKSEAFDKQRAALLQKATDDAETERQRLAGEARKEAEALEAKSLEAQKQGARDLAQSIARRTSEEVFATAHKVLADLSSVSLEERIVDKFIVRLRAMSGTAKAGLGEALKTTAEPAVLRSAFALPPAQRQLIEAALSNIFAAKTPVRFEIAPELIGGIDLSANGQKIGWSIGDYLNKLEKSQPAAAAQ